MVKLLEVLDRHTARHLFRSSHLKLSRPGNAEFGANCSKYSLRG